MKRAIITYAEGAHEELLDVALPTYQKFAELHGYKLRQYRNVNFSLPPAWYKIPLLLNALSEYEEVVWFDCDLVVVNSQEDFPPIPDGKLHAMVRHFEDNSEVPNSGVWRLKRGMEPLLNMVMELEVFRGHGWWEQAAIMTLMGYTVPPEGSNFSKTRCKNVVKTKWYNTCNFMRLCWNSHSMYRAENPRIVHCSYENMTQRLEVMRELVKNPRYDYPKFDGSKEGESENK